MQETDRPAWATEVFNPCPVNTPEGMRNILWHDIVHSHGWEETFTALAEIAGIPGIDPPDPELVLRLQMLATLAKEKEW